MLEQLRNPDRRVVGVKQLLRALEANAVSCVFVAADADPALTRRVLAAARAAGVQAMQVDTMAALGRACRIHVGAAAAGLRRGED